MSTPVSPSASDCAPKPLRQPGLLVYLCGIATSALVLWGVHLANENGENIMGWYASGIIPAGALIVGVASGIGYALGSRFLNVKLSKAFVVGMITTGLVDYVAAQYLTYLHVLEQQHIPEEDLSFWAYIQFISEQMSFKRSGSSEAGGQMGAFGYIFKFLEMSGYALGSMLPSLAVFGMPYCKSCQKYLKQQSVGFINGPERWAEVKKLDKNTRLLALQHAIENVSQRAQEVTDQIVNAPLPVTVSHLSTLDAKADSAAAVKIQFALKKCPCCDAHLVTLNLLNKTVDKKDANSGLLTLDKTQLHLPQQQPQ